MQIGAIGAASFNPYIYNTNRVNSSSLNKISGIGSDLTSGKTDFGSLTSQENINPLRRGESLDFAGIIDMQMHMSRLNAERIMKPPVEAATQAAGIAENMQEDSNVNANGSITESVAGAIGSATGFTENAVDSAASVPSAATERTDQEVVANAAFQGMFDVMA